MSIGNDPGAKKHKAKDLRKASSPGKIYQSRASKPSGVAKLALDASATYVEAEIQSIADKLDELIDALKK